MRIYIRKSYVSRRIVIVLHVTRNGLSCNFYFLDQSSELNSTMRSDAYIYPYQRLVLSFLLSHLNAVAILHHVR